MVSLAPQGKAHDSLSQLVALTALGISIRVTVRSFRMVGI